MIKFVIEKTEQQVSPEGVPVCPKKTIYQVKNPMENLTLQKRPQFILTNRRKEK